MGTTDAGARDTGPHARGNAAGQAVAGRLRDRPTRQE